MPAHPRERPGTYVREPGDNRPFLMLFSLAFILLITSAVWRLLSGNRLNMMKEASAAGVEGLAQAISRVNRASLHQAPGPDINTVPRDTVAAAALKEREIVRFTAFSRNRTFRYIALSFFVMAGVAGIILIALGISREDVPIAFNGGVFLLTIFTLWATLAIIASINERSREVLGILTNILGEAGVGEEELRAADPGPSRIVRIEFVFFGLFLLLWIIRLLLAFAFDISSTISSIVLFCSIFLLVSGFTYMVRRASRSTDK